MQDRAINSNNIKIVDAMQEAGYMVERLEDITASNIISWVADQSGAIEFWTIGDLVDPVNGTYKNIQIVINDSAVPEERTIINYNDIQMIEVGETSLNGKKKVAFMNRDTGEKHIFDNVARGDQCPYCHSIDVVHEYVGSMRHRRCESCGQPF